jgi:SAM-dependent methyltransferase
MHDTDKAWEQWGARDPYYGVLTSEEYRGLRLDEDRRRAFFEGGRRHLAEILETIRSRLCPEFAPGRAVDFGCGTGRVLIPMAGVCAEATGLDVSDAMLAECRANCRRAGLGNVVLGKSDDRLSALSGRYDFIHSFIVFQHIRRPRGERIAIRLLGHLADGGVAVLHFACGWDAGVMQRAAYFARHRIPLAHAAMNWWRGRPVDEPRMEMNLYDENRLRRLAGEAGIETLHAEPVRHGAHRGVVLYLARRPAS